MKNHNVSRAKTQASRSPQKAESITIPVCIPSGRADSNAPVLGDKSTNPQGISRKGLGGKIGSNPVGHVSTFPLNHIGIGWTEATAPPTIKDLLPPDVAQKMLDLWLATGANVLLDAARRIIGNVEEGATGCQDCFLDTLEADVMERLQAVANAWEGGPEA